ncbi:MAG: ATP-binding cassette domain-containing protein [Thomasclavelia sp.]
MDLYNTRNNISYTPQEDIVINDSIISNIMFDQNTNLKLEELKKLFSRFSFERFNNVKIDELWNTMINEHGSNYSGGEIKKLMLIRTFIKNSSVIILDEPSNSLDSESKKTLIKLIEEKKDDSIIIIVTHDQDLKKIADHIIEL